MHSDGGDVGQDLAHEERWRELVQRLHGQIDVVVEEFVHRLRALPTYRMGAVPLTLVREDAVLSFDYLFRQLAGMPALAALGIAARVGRDRARRQVPLEHLLRAVRLDFQVVWSVLQQLAGPEDLPVLVEHVEQIWTVVEDYTTEVQVCYMNERALIAREQNVERTALVARLLDGPELDADALQLVATALGVRTGSSFLVAAVPIARQTALHRAFENLVAAGRPAHWQERGAHGLLVAEWHGLDDAAVDSVLGPVPCGVAPVAVGLAQVRKATSVAERIADVTRPDDDRPRRLRDVLDRLVSTGLGDLRGDVSAAVLGALDTVTARERERLLETVTVYLDSRGVHETASQLYCHRNTVLNRVHRFASLTGYDVTRPRDAAAVVMALGCAD